MIHAQNCSGYRRFHRLSADDQALFSIAFSGEDYIERYVCSCQLTDFEQDPVPGKWMGLSELGKTRKRRHLHERCKRCQLPGLVDFLAHHCIWNGVEDGLLEAKQAESWEPPSADPPVADLKRREPVPKLLLCLKASVPQCLWHRVDPLIIMGRLGMTDVLVEGPLQKTIPVGHPRLDEFLCDLGFPQSRSQDKDEFT